MFEAAEAVMRPDMVMGEWRLGSGGLEAVMVMFGGSACSMLWWLTNFRVAFVPTGTKLGVSIIPWGV